MARKKTGSKTSKRVTCKRRYKIEKKVREHLKKEKKVKDGKIKKGVRSNKKNIRVPNKFPFKEEVLKEAQEHKERLEKERQVKKTLQKKNREKLVNEKRNLEFMVKDAERKTAVYEQKNSFIQENALKLGSRVNVETSLKTFYKEVKNVIEKSDVIIEVLDARDPLGSRCRQLEETVVSCGKKLILLLNKIDLVPKENLEVWLKYLRNELPALPFKACTQQQSDKLSNRNIMAMLSKDGAKKTSSCLGADLLLGLLSNYCRNKDIKTSITIGIVGFPNTGKSSIINSLKRSKACNVGSTPGVTKTMQAVQLDKNIKMIDSPGVVMATNMESEEELILKNCVKLEALKDAQSVIDVIVSKCNKWQLMTIYTLPEFKDSREFLEFIAKRYGLLKKGGIPDLNKAAKRVIKDWNEGKITYYSRPPEESASSSHISTEVVREMKEAFNIDALFNEEVDIVKGLHKTAKDYDMVFTLNKVSDGTIQPHEGADIDMVLANGNGVEDGDDEEEGDDDGLEKMEEDGPETKAKTIVHVEPKVAKKQVKEGQKKVKFADQLPGNEQLNKERKMEFKKILKKRNKSDKLADHLGTCLRTAMNMKSANDNDYNFDEHF